MERRQLGDRCSEFKYHKVDKLLESGLQLPEQILQTLGHWIGAIPSESHL